MSEARSRVPLEHDAKGHLIKTHGYGGYVRGCGCDVCSKAKDERKPPAKRQRAAKPEPPEPQDPRTYAHRATVPLSGLQAEAVETVRKRLGMTRGEWLREAVVGQLARDGIEVVDELRRPATRRPNWSERQQQEGQQ